MLVSILELGSITYFRVSSGQFLSNSEWLAAEAGDFVRKEAREDCSYRDFIFPHPYLAWVHHANEPCGWDKVSRQGLYGADIPAEREPGVFRILLTGGSVAVQLGSVKGEQSLEKVLNRKFGNEYRRFELINAAIEAWKQPQQLIATMLYSPAVDGIISLEGFNEFLAINRHSELGQRMDTPWQPSYYASNPFFEQSSQSPVASWVNQELYRFSRDHWLGSRSKFLLLLSNVIRAESEDWALESRKDWTNENTSLESIFSLSDKTPDGLLDWNLKLYRHYLVSMNAVASQSGTRLAVLMQPTPARFRTMGGEEAGRVGDLSYATDYEAMENALIETDGTGVFSLARIYENVEEPIYTDAIHQEVEGIGYQIMAEEIATIIGTHWQLKESL